MRKTVFLIFFPFFLQGENSFITDYEYAKMLYENPRGIGCDKCHTKNAGGKKIASYYDKKKKKTVYIETPDIRELDKKSFFKAFKNNHSVMPTYFLTIEELESLYYYVQNQKKLKKDKNEHKK